MRIEIVVLTWICFELISSIPFLQDLYFKPVRSYTHKMTGDYNSNCLSGDHFYIIHDGKVDKLDYRQNIIVQTFKSSLYVNGLQCLYRAQTKQLVVTYLKPNPNPLNNISDASGLNSVGNYIVNSIVVWNQTTGLVSRVLNEIPNNIINMIYSPETKQIIVSTQINGTLYFIDYDKLQIKRSYSTLVKNSGTASQFSKIFKAPYCQNSILTKNKDYTLIFNPNINTPQFHNVSTQKVSSKRDTVLASPNCQQFFYTNLLLQTANQTSYAIFKRLAKNENYSLTWEKRIPVPVKIDSLEFLDSKKQLFLLFTQEQCMLYDYLHDQVQFYSIYKQPKSARVHKVFVNDNTKQFLVDRFNSTILYNWQCKGLKYFSVKQMKCLLCQKNCLQCSQNYSICSECKQGFYQSEVHCLACSLPCETCQGSSRNCTSCPANYVQQGNSCVVNSTSLIYLFSVSTSVLSYFHYRASIQLISYLNEFWPYYYHHRNYSKLTNDFLETVHYVENNKWLFGGLDKEIKFTYNQLNFSVYNSYSNPKFLEKQNKSSYFLDSIFEFLTYSLPIFIFICFTLNIVFKFLFEYKISFYIRKYAFLMTFFVSTMESNLIYITFCSMSSIKILFSFKFQDKFGHIISILFMFVLIFHVFAAFFLIKYIYQRLGKYFIEDCRLTMGSFTLYTIMNIRALLIGTVQAFLYENYQLQVWFLTAIQLSTLIAIALSQAKSKCFKQQSLLFAIIIKQTMIIVFNLFLLADYRISLTQNEQSVELCDSLIMDVIYIMTAIVIFKVVTTLFPSRFQRLNESVKKPNKKEEHQEQDQFISNESHTKIEVFLIKKQQTISRNIKKVKFTKIPSQKDRTLKQTDNSRQIQDNFFYNFSSKGNFKGSNAKKENNSKNETKIPERNEKKGGLTLRNVFQNSDSPEICSIPESQNPFLMKQRRKVKTCKKENNNDLLVLRFNVIEE